MSFHLRNSNGLYLNVKVPACNRPTKHNYEIYYSTQPVSKWYMHDNEKHTGVIHLHNSLAFYDAYDIEYSGSISLSHTASDWKLTDGLSTCCFRIEDNNIRHPINKQITLWHIKK